MSYRRVDKLYGTRYVNFISIISLTFYVNSMGKYFFNLYIPLYNNFRSVAHFRNLIWCTFGFMFLKLKLFLLQLSPIYAFNGSPTSGARNNCYLISPYLQDDSRIGSHNVHFDLPPRMAKFLKYSMWVSISWVFFYDFNKTRGWKYDNI